MNNEALIVIDLQNDITKNYKEIIERVNEAIDWAVSDNGFLIYEMLMPHDIQAKIINPTGSDIRAFEHINYIQSVLK